MHEWFKCIDSTHLVAHRVSCWICAAGFLFRSWLGQYRDVLGMVRLPDKLSLRRGVATEQSRVSMGMVGDVIFIIQSFCCS